MKRIILVAVSTFAALVALFSYPTSTGQSGSTAAQPVSAARVVTGAGTPMPTTTGQGPDPATGTRPSTAAPSSAAKPSTDPTSPAASTTSAPATSAPGTTPATVTVDGAAEMTSYGTVQVQVTITGGKITDVTAIDYPQTDGRDIQINGYAIPQLRAQVLQAQSAKIDGVSGATFTSDGYLTSLQSALDAAGFAG